MPQEARWEMLRNQAKQPEIGQLLDDALIAIEDFSPSLKNILDKRFARTQIEPARFGAPIDLISKIGFTSEDKAKDVLGEVSNGSCVAGTTVNFLIASETSPRRSVLKRKGVASVLIK